MEQAVNTFAKGLQSDTHPMVQGTDTMTDCLNGTLVTMNGNEVILQNDMGNRRVNNAFLPSGYQPVGMKEHGGIIYVAAYNPITNKSQIGSFPSPQRKFDSEQKLSGEFDFSDFTKESNIEKDEYLGINVLKSDSFMVPLTGDTVLHAGDKFSIYSPNLYEKDGDGTYKWLNDITNFNNIADDKKAYSPKNKKYTLFIGVLNSQNEFVDITNTLCRWDEDEIINFDSSVSDIYKFNKGYFISSEFNNSNFSITQDNDKLIKTRQKQAINTYAYKLIGPMYLKAKYNHIESFNYNIINGEYKDGKASLSIEGYFTYNCPDGVHSFTNGNSDYQTFEEGEVLENIIGFDLIASSGKLNSTTRETSQYNSNSNTYSVKITKHYTDITPEKDSTIFNYVLGVYSGIDNVYLSDISAKGSLDLSLFESGKVFFTEWRFRNNVDTETYLVFSLNCYPKQNEEFRNLKLKFTDLSTIEEEEPTSFIYDKFKIYNGRQTALILWDEKFPIEKQKVYQVTTTYDIYNIETGNVISQNVPIDDLTPVIKEKFTGTNVESTPLKELSNRWFLSTELFNNISYSISDFCNTSDAEFLKLLKVEISIEKELEPVSLEINKNIFNGIYEKNNEGKFSFSCEETHNLTFELGDETKYKISNSLPLTIDLKNAQYSFDELKIVSEVKSVGNPDIDNINVDNIKYENNLEITDNKNKITGNIKFFQEFYGINKSLVSQVKYGFSSLKYDLFKNYCDSLFSNYGSNVGPNINDSQQPYGFQGILGFRIGTNYSVYDVIWEDIEDKDWYGWYVREMSHNSTRLRNFFNTSQKQVGWGNEVQIEYPKWIASDQVMFTWCFDNNVKELCNAANYKDIQHHTPTFCFTEEEKNNFINQKVSNIVEEDVNNYRLGIRIWWKTSNNSFALFPEIWEPIKDVSFDTYVKNDFYKQIFQSFYKYICKQFNQDYIYYMYDNKSPEDFYCPNEGTCIYMYPEVTMKISYNCNNANIKYYSIGNLKFNPQIITNLLTYIEKSQHPNNFFELLNSRILEKVDIYNGKMFDKNQKPLECDHIYNYLDGNLQISENENLFSFKIGDGSDYKTLLNQKLLFYNGPTDNNNNKYNYGVCIPWPYVNREQENLIIKDNSIVLDYSNSPTVTYL